jgi:antitoxin Phd
MKTWSLRDAQARLSDLVDACLRDGPQLVTRSSVHAVVRVPADQWQRITAAAKPMLKELLLTDAARGQLLVAPAQRRRRPLPPFERGTAGQG